MTARSHAIRDSVTMLRRNLRHLLRYPGMTIGALAVPLLMLLLFRYAFGAALAAGVRGPGPGPGAGQPGVRGTAGGYIDYLAPGVAVLAVSSASLFTAVAVSMDMTEGIVNRFRTMAIARVSVLTGHVLASVIQTVGAAVLVTALAVLLGFRPVAGAAGWLGAFALLIALAVALTWVSVALGLAAKNPESASNTPMPLLFLPFLGSAFVPPESMAPGLRWFAEYQPFTPVIDALRGLLLGRPAGDQPLIALAWCAGLALAGYLSARTLYNRRPAR